METGVKKYDNMEYPDFFDEWQVNFVKFLSALREKKLWKEPPASNLKAVEMLTAGGKPYYAFFRGQSNFLNPDVLEEMKKNGDTKILRVTATTAGKADLVPIKLKNMLLELNAENKNTVLVCGGHTLTEVWQELYFGKEEK